MPITPFLDGRVFDDELIRAMDVAFERCCQSLRLTDKSAPLTRLVAAKIILGAKSGERDPDRLYGATMGWVRNRRSQPR